MFMWHTCNHELVKYLLSSKKQLQVCTTPVVQAVMRVVKIVITASPHPLPNVGSCKIQKSQTCLKLVMAAKCSSTKQTFINKLFCWLCLAGRTPRLLGMSRFSYYWYAVPKHTHHWSSTLIINLHVYIHDIWINIHINIYFNTHINIHIDIYMNIYIHNILLITA